MAPNQLQEIKTDKKNMYEWVGINEPLPPRISTMDYLTVSAESELKFDSINNLREFEYQIGEKLRTETYRLRPSLAKVVVLSSINNNAYDEMQRRLAISHYLRSNKALVNYKNDDLLDIKDHFLKMTASIWNSTLFFKKTMLFKYATFNSTRFAVQDALDSPKRIKNEKKYMEKQDQNQNDKYQWYFESESEPESDSRSDSDTDIEIDLEDISETDSDTGDLKVWFDSESDNDIDVETDYDNMDE